MGHAEEPGFGGPSGRLGAGAIYACIRAANRSGRSSPVAIRPAPAGGGRQTRDVSTALSARILLGVCPSAEPARYAGRDTQFEVGENAGLGGLRSHAELD